MNNLSQFIISISISDIATSGLAVVWYKTVLLRFDICERIVLDNRSNYRLTLI